MRSSCIGAVASTLALALTACGGEETSGDSGAGAGGAAGGHLSAGNPSGGHNSPIAGGAGTAGFSATGGRFGSGGSFPTGGARAASDCNTVINTASVVALTVVAENPPTPMGGTILDGTYHLTDYRAFTGPGGSTTSPLASAMQYTIVISASTGTSARLEGVAAITVGGMSITEEANVSLSYGGTSYVSTITCSTASGSGDAGSYTATTNQLVVMSASTTGETMVATFTRQ